MLTRTLRNAASRRSLISASKANFHSSKPLNEVMTVRDTLRIAMSDEMRRDPNVFLMGEEVGVY